MATVAPKPLSRRDVETKIIALAWQDEDFRRKFIADPRGQFEEKLGTKLPEGMRMTAHQEDENNLHFVIPMKPRTNVDELSDEQLEKIAGGTDVAVTFMVTVAVSMTLISAAGVVTGVQSETGWIK